MGETASEVEAENKRLAKALKKKKTLLAALAAAEATDTPELAEGVDTADDSRLPGSEKADKIVSELSGSGSFEIYRDENGKNVRVGSYDLESWPEAMETCVRNKGGGDYLVVFRRANGAQAGRISRTYDKSSYPGVSGAKAAPAGGEDLFLKFLEVQDRRESSYRAELSSMRAELAKSQADATRTMIEALRASSKPLLSSVQDIVAISGLFNKKSDPIEEYLKLRDVIDELKETDSPSVSESPLAAVLDRIAKTVLPLLVKAPLVAPVAEPAPERRTAALPDAPPVEAARPQPKPLNIEPFLNGIVTAIEGGTTPEDSADTVYISTSGSAENREAIVTLLNSGDWAPAYSHAFLSQHKDWLDKFREVLKAKFSAPAA